MIFDTDTKKIQRRSIVPQSSTATTQPINTSTLQPNDLLQLQASIGNQAVGAMLQRSTAPRHTPPRQISQPPQTAIQRTPDT